MIIKRKKGKIERIEGWGILQYDTVKHRFSYIKKNGKDAIPYIREPVVLNVDLTMKCNMACRHCVTKDFEPRADLAVSVEMITWINKSPFMVVVITGGEPFLPEYENKLMILLKKIRNKGLVVDTNGSLFPSRSLIEIIKKTNTLVRISWDSIRPHDEIYLRQVKPDSERNRNINMEYYFNKVNMIKRLRLKGVNVAIQSVIHRKNLTSIIEMPTKLRDFSIKQWYIQRLIPSHIVKEMKYLQITDSEYDSVISELTKRSNQENIECITKKDRRHNCVFLLIGDGHLYTQGQKPGQKILLGTIHSNIRYFDYVSSSDHADRYYG